MLPSPSKSAVRMARQFWEHPSLAPQDEVRVSFAPVDISQILIAPYVASCHKTPLAVAITPSATCTSPMGLHSDPQPGPPSSTFGCRCRQTTSTRAGRSLDCPTGLPAGRPRIPSGQDSTACCIRWTHRTCRSIRKVEIVRMERFVLIMPISPSIECSAVKAMPRPWSLKARRIPEPSPRALTQGLCPNGMQTKTC